MYTLSDKICAMLGEKGITAKKFFQLLSSLNDLDELPDVIADNKRLESLFGDSYVSVCKALKDCEQVRLFSDMERNGVEVITWFSDKYPSKLRDIDEPPYVLFCKGNVSLLNKDGIAVVGTRKISSYGRRVAADFTRLLADDFVIVSGLAYGVDSVAHEVTLQEQGETVAVLGSGILNIYPSANEGLAKRIVDNGGLVVSEYGLRAQPLAYRFPHRNRLVAGLAKGLLVCQAPLKSGTNSTVELALQQGKDIFVVPGEIYDSGFSGSNNLIKSMQGACVTTPRDIIDYYGLDNRLNDNKTVQLNFQEQRIVDALSLGGKTFDQLVVETSLQPSELNFLLANLELRSIIARLPGNTYRLYGGIE